MQIAKRTKTHPPTSHVGDFYALAGTTTIVMYVLMKLLEW